MEIIIGAESVFKWVVEPQGLQTRTELESRILMQIGSFFRTWLELR